MIYNQPLHVIARRLAPHERQRYAYRSVMRLGLVLVSIFIANSAFSESAYRNPADAKYYVADGNTYQPTGSATEQTGRVTNVGVTLLNSQADFERNTSAQELAKLVGYIQDNLALKAKQYPEAGEVLLQVALNKDRNPEFKMSFQGDLNQDFLQSFYSSLAKIDLRAKLNTVTLQIHFAIKHA